MVVNLCLHNVKHYHLSANHIGRSVSAGAFTVRPVAVQSRAQLYIISNCYGPIVTRSLDSEDPENAAPVRYVVWRYVRCATRRRRNVTECEWHDN